MQSSKMKSSLLTLLSAIAALGAAIGSGCSDPTRDRQIEALGPDTETPGPDHRPGQPCILCHSEGGPAESKAFAIAGTVYKTSKVGEDGIEGVVVQFIAANDSKPVALPSTGPTGNFFVPVEDWPDIVFPIRVALYNNEDDPPVQTMKSLINKEASCNFCHRPNVDPKKTDDEDVAKDLSRQSAGQIYMQ